MTLLTPLGLLGLIGILILIIIYLLKPNYQQKFISTTFVWKLSLKYRKRRIPTSKLRNVILIICQVLLLVTCSAILAGPNQIIKSRIQEPEVVIVIDSSASMRALNSKQQTRYSRAVENAAALASQTYEEQGFVSIIVASSQPYYLCKRVGLEQRAEVDSALQSMADGTLACSYSTSDLEGGIALTEDVLEINPDAKVYLCTDQYSGGDNARVPKGVELISLRDGEVNGAIINATTTFEENYYTFIVDVACYGMDKRVDVCVDVYGANAVDSNDAGRNVAFTKTVDCIGEQITKVIFVNQAIYEENREIYDRVYGVNNVFPIPDDSRVYSYQSIHVSLLEQSGVLLEDSLLEDNTFDIYGGQKQVIKVQYASDMPNSFWPAVLREIRSLYSDKWDVQIDQVKKGDEPELNGYDLYIFEHVMPKRMPDDGVVFAVNPDTMPSTSGVMVSLISIKPSNNPLGEPLSMAEKHPLLSHVGAENITVSLFRHMILDGNYEVLLEYSQYPMLAVRNDADMKAVIMAFSLHYSTLPVILEFPFLVYNTFEYFFPSTIEKNAYAVDQTVTLNARSDQLTISGYELNQTFTSFPATVKVSTPGTYTLKQTVYSGATVTEKFFVNLPSVESNVCLEGEKLTGVNLQIDLEEYLKDLLLVLAIALTVIVFVEWLIRSHDSW